MSNSWDLEAGMTREQQTELLARLDAKIAQLEEKNPNMWRAYEWYLPRNIDDTVELPEAG